MQRLRLVAVCLALACESSTFPGLAPNQLVAVEAIDAIRSDATFIYYVQNANADTPNSPLALQLMRVPVDGGMLSVLSSLPSPDSITSQMAPFAIDDTTAYCPINAQIVEVPLTGGQASTVVDEGVAARIAALTVDATSLYWLVGVSGDPLSTVWVMPKSGSTPTSLVADALFTSQTREIAVDASHLYWPGMSGSAVQSNDVVWSVPINGGTAAIVAANQTNPIVAASDGINLYWVNAGTDESDGQLIALSLSSASNPAAIAQNLPIQLPAQNEPNPTRIQVVDGNVFWNDRVGVHSIANGTITTYFGDAVLFFTVDASNVYWATSVGIFRAPRLN